MTAHSALVSATKFYEKRRSEMICYVRFLGHVRTTALDLRYTRRKSIEAISTCIANEDHETTNHLK
jgi:hypothetical protein